MNATRIGALVVALTGSALAKGPAGTAVDVKGHYYETCDCAVSCPCATTKFKPTDNHCDAMMFFHLDKASVGATKLDGLNMAFVMKSPKDRLVMEAFSKGELDHWAVYLDDKTTEDQKKVIPQLMEAMFGKMEIKGGKPPVYVPIKLVTEGDSAKVDVAGGKLTADIERIKVGETKAGDKVTPKYISLDGAVPFPWMGAVQQGQSHGFHYADGAIKWDYKDRNAYFGEFTHKASLPAAK
jgi:hypothetical protein